MFPGVSGEFVEIDRMAHVVEVLVDEIEIGLLAQPAALFAHHPRPRGIGAGERLRDEAEEFPRRAGSALCFPGVADVETQHVPERLTKVPAGIGVVTDHGDTLRSQLTLADT